MFAQKHHIDAIVRSLKWQKTLNKIRSGYYQSSFYQWSLRQKRPFYPQTLPQNQYFYPLQRSDALFQGRFLYGRLKTSEAEAPWHQYSEDDNWQSYIHGFRWLSDLKSDDKVKKQTTLRRYVFQWISDHKTWSAQAWRADVLSNRLISWLLHCPNLLENAENAFRESFIKAIDQHANHLMRCFFLDLSGFPYLEALKGQLYCALFIERFHKKREKILLRLCNEINQQLLPDGGHQSRSGDVLLSLLSLCLEVKKTLEQLKIECPADLNIAIDRIAPMIRTLRHTDGTMARFHGSMENDPDWIDHLLEMSGNMGKPLSNARHCGYQRIDAHKTVLLVDVGSPPSLPYNQTPHAAPLSFELSVDDERLLVNCGSILETDRNWQQALSQTQAHNTLCVDGRSCYDFDNDAKLVMKETTLEAERLEENGHVLIETSHDAYKEAFGLIHHRSLYLNKTGDDLRIEDKLIGQGGQSFEISLHLHPNVHASIDHEGQAVLLKTQKQSGWYLRLQGAKVDLRESIYMDDRKGPVPTDQIVIFGPLRGEGCVVKWSLRKIT